MEHDFFESGYGWMCNKHPFVTMKQCLENDMNEIKGKASQFFYLDELGEMQDASQIIDVESWTKWSEDQEELQHQLIMTTTSHPLCSKEEIAKHLNGKHGQYVKVHKVYPDDCPVCKSWYSDSYPPVAQLAEAPDSKPEQSEFESQQEDAISPACPQCGMLNTLSIRQVIKQEDYQSIHSVSRNKDGLKFVVGEPQNETFLDVLESYLLCSSCMYEVRMGEDDYSVVAYGYGV